MGKPDFPKVITILVGLSLLLALFRAQWVRAQEANQAGLVIVHGNGQVVTRCVQFSEPEISGYDVLQRAGLDLNIEAGGTGAAICRIDNEGCTYPQQSCFCGTEGDSYIYWSYWHLNGGIWQYSNLGASNQRVQPGAVEGWLWGAGSVAGATPPPLITLAQICVPPTVIPTPTVPPPATFSPTATFTPLPTATATTTATLAPTAIATPLPLPPRIDLFTADRSVLPLGETVLLRWAVSDAATVLLRDGANETPVAASGELRLTPPSSTIYTLVARNGGGEVTAMVNVTVNLPTATSLPTSIPVAATATLLPLPSDTVTPLPTATLVPPTATWTVTPLPTATLVPLTATLQATATPLPTATATLDPPTVIATATTQAVTQVPVISNLPTATSTAAMTRQQAGMLLAAVGLVVALPLGLLCLVGLIWLLRRRE